MSKNENLNKAKQAKQDEFYTRFCDIETEMNILLEHNPNLFQDTTVLLPCDDPEWSNFAAFFVSRFTELGIKKLISTCCSSRLDPQSTNGKILILDREQYPDNDTISLDNVRWCFLEGDGDFRSEEITALRDEADIIITNPPFSLFREFISWLEEGTVKYAVIGSVNAVTTQEVFPYIKSDKL